MSIELKISEFKSDLVNDNFTSLSDLTDRINVILADSAATTIPGIISTIVYSGMMVTMAVY